jgi:hypothetical protein
MAVFGHRIGFGDGAPLRRAGTAVALMAVVTWGAAAPAQAAPGSDTTVVETVFRTGAGGSVSVTTTCPPGRRVVGGGVGRASNGTAANVVQVSGPVDATGNTADTDTGDVARGWLASVKVDSASQFVVFALCSATSDATIAQSTFLLGANAIKGSGDSTCPPGTRVVGGGVGTPNPSETVDSQVALSGPLGQSLTVPNTGDVARAWGASVANTGAGQFYKVFALCSASSDATIAEASFSFPDGAQREGGNVAVCPAGRRALGGGIVTTASTVSSTVRRSAPQVAAGAATTQSAVTNGATVDTDVSRRWAAAVVNADDSRTYKVLALCAADEPPPPVTPAGGANGNAGGAGNVSAGAVDKSAPNAHLAGKKTEKLDSAVEVLVDCSASKEDCFASATGTLTTPGASKTFRLKGVKAKRIAAGKRATLKLKLPEKALRAGKRARRRHKKVKAKIRVTVKDAAGNPVTLKGTIGLS